METHWLIDAEGNILHEQEMSPSDARNRNLELEAVGSLARWESQEVHNCVPLPSFGTILCRALAVTK